MYRWVFTNLPFPAGFVCAVNLLIPGFLHNGCPTLLLPTQPSLSFAFGWITNVLYLLLSSTFDVDNDKVIAPVCL